MRNEIWYPMAKQIQELQSRVHKLEEQIELLSNHITTNSFKLIELESQYRSSLNEVKKATTQI